ncbi:MAG: DUF350 domain-containing protein [Deltaproteobacteria bacterium]|nr:DUF350 domain-containing protein [bacterium]MCB9477591.1 DUF350 domain-containing protein [Deltaproteobacteria bacterium]MCB9487486.1 DUF350 domain-containing protein [Deltaproteobacteria bacterium]
MNTTELVPLAPLVQTLVYTAIGIVIFSLAFWAIVKIAPFSIRKEIEDDQNMALALIVGAVIIGLAIIIGAVISS